MPSQGAAPDPPTTAPAHRATVTAVMLAGGRATRFGTNKLAASFDGAPLLSHALRAVAAVADEVVMALAADAPLLPALALPGLGVPLRVVHDRSAGLGPLAGLAAAAPGAAPRLLVVAGDMPFLAPALLEGLLDALGARAAAVLGDGGRWRPLPCVMRTVAARRAVASRVAGTDRSIRGLLLDLDPVIVAETAWRAWDPDGAWRVDVDRPADLAAALQGRSGREEAT